MSSHATHSFASPAVTYDNGTNDFIQVHAPIMFFFVCKEKEKEV